MKHIAIDPIIWRYCCVILFGLLWGSDVQAHRLKLFASAQGLEIKGSVYFAGGASAKDISVDIYLNEKKLTQLITDSQGQFSYLASQYGEYKIIANAGSGHVSRFNLTLGDPNTASPLPSKTESSTVPIAPESPKIAEAYYCTNEIGVRDLESALHPLHTQLFALQQQLDAYEAKIRWHDILGGLGYIFGLAGLWLWWQTRCFSSKNTNGESPCTSQKVR